MASGESRDLLSIGIILVIVIASILLYTPLQIISDWTLIFPLIIALSGLWIMVLAGMRASNPQKYARGAFSTLSWGALLVAIGGAWFLYSYGWVYSLIVILLVFALLAIAAAIKRK
jgi:uncharacterized Tic20 family protein